MAHARVPLGVGFVFLTQARFQMLVWGNSRQSFADPMRQCFVVLASASRSNWICFSEVNTRFALFLWLAWVHLGVLKKQSVQRRWLLVCPARMLSGTGDASTAYTYTNESRVCGQLHGSVDFSLAPSNDDRCRCRCRCRVHAGHAAATVRFWGQVSWCLHVPTSSKWNRMPQQTKPLPGIPVLCVCPHVSDETLDATAGK